MGGSTGIGPDADGRRRDDCWLAQDGSPIPPVIRGRSPSRAADRPLGRRRKPLTLVAQLDQSVPLVFRRQRRGGAFWAPSVGACGRWLPGLVGATTSSGRCLRIETGESTATSHRREAVRASPVGSDANAIARGKQVCRPQDGGDSRDTGRRVAVHASTARSSAMAPPGSHNCHWKFHPQDESPSVYAPAITVYQAQGCSGSAGHAGIDRERR